MSVNFLGLEQEEVTPEGLEDVLKEAVNMVAGSFLGKEKVPGDYHLQPPQVLHLDLNGQVWEENCHHLLLAVEDAGLEVFLDKAQ
jgi:hypothetical protein